MDAFDDAGTKRRWDERAKSFCRCVDPDRFGLVWENVLAQIVGWIVAVDECLKIVVVLLSFANLLSGDRIG